LSLFYIVSHVLNKKGIIKRKFHKKLWNWLITASFIVMGITGVELTLFINFGIQSTLNQAITFWHAVASIVMVVTTIFHVHMYWKSFKMSFKLFKSPDKLKREKLRSSSLDNYSN
jgi:cytochrome b subunit of formate dehydrogenase